MSVGITLQALFARATTTVDGGWNITFSVSQAEAKEVMQLSQLRDQVLQLAVVPYEIRRAESIPACEDEELPTDGPEILL